MTTTTSEICSTGSIRLAQGQSIPLSEITGDYLMNPDVDWGISFQIRLHSPDPNGGYIFSIPSATPSVIQESQDKHDLIITFGENPDIEKTPDGKSYEDDNIINDIKIYTKFHGWHQGLASSYCAAKENDWQTIVILNKRNSGNAFEIEAYTDGINYPKIRTPLVTQSFTYSPDSQDKNPAVLGGGVDAEFKNIMFWVDTIPTAEQIANNNLPPPDQIYYSVIEQLEQPGSIGIANVDKGFSKNDWKRLVGIYMPQVMLSGNEPYNDRYKPSSIDWYLSRCTLKESEPDGNDKDIESDPTRETLAVNTGDESARMYLEPKNESAYNGSDEPNNYKRNIGAKMYAHVRKANAPAKSDWIDIQYWFFYPYNGKTGNISIVGGAIGFFMGGPVGVLRGFAAGSMPLPIKGDHEGDWEHVTVRVSNWRNLNNGKIEAVFFSAHGKREGKWLMNDSKSFTLKDETHVVVYSAWHSHASYEDSGLHFRLYSFGNDFCSGGYEWGYTGNINKDADRVELSWIDDEGNNTVYHKNDEKIENAKWLEFKGLWGKKDGPPRGPKQQGQFWPSDGDNGYYYSTEPLATIGSNWPKDRRTSSIAFGVLGEDAKQVVGVALNKNSSRNNYRFEIYHYSQTKGLEFLAGDGRNWDIRRVANSIAFGWLEGKGIFGVAMNKGSDKRSPAFMVYNYEKTLNLLASGGSFDHGWDDKDRKATSIAFGEIAYVSGNIEGNHISEDIEPQSLLGVARDDGKFFIYQMLKDGGSYRLDFLASDSTTKWINSIAFGFLGDKYVIGVAFDKGRKNRNSRFAIYELIELEKNKIKLGLLVAGGIEWETDRAATAIDFGILDNKPVVGVSRGKGSSSPFYVYEMVKSEHGDYQLKVVTKGDSRWSDRRDTMGIAFGKINGEGVVGVTREGGTNAEVHLYKFENETLVPYKSTGERWSNSYGASCIAFGHLGDMPVVGYCRDADKNSRAAILGWK